MQVRWTTSSVSSRTGFGTDMITTGHPAFDAQELREAPLTTSFRTAGQWERQHRAMVPSTRTSTATSLLPVLLDDQASSTNLRSTQVTMSQKCLNVLRGDVGRRSVRFQLGQNDADDRVSCSCLCFGQIRGRITPMSTGVLPSSFRRRLSFSEQQRCVELFLDSQSCAWRGLTRQVYCGTD